MNAADGPLPIRNLPNTNLAGDTSAMIGNRLNIDTLSSGDRATIDRELTAHPVSVQNFADTFAQVRQQGAPKAASFAVAYSASLHTNDEVGQFFEDIALAPQTDRIAVLDAHKAAGYAEGV